MIPQPSLNENNTTSYDSIVEQNRRVTDGESNQFKLYKKRWFVLLVVCLVNFSNAVIWICYASVANYINDFYGNSQSANWLSMIFMVVSIPLGFVAMWSVDRFGLKTGLYFGCVANLIGGVIRIFSYFPSDDSKAFRLGIVLLGQFIAACAQPFIMFLPTKTAALWFPKNQRAIANTAGSMCIFILIRFVYCLLIYFFANPFGIMVAMLVPSFIVTKESNILTLNIMTAIPALIVAVMALVGVQSSTPPTPPTKSAEELSSDFWPGFKNAFRSRPFLILVFCLGGGFGLFNSCFTLIEQILCPKGYDNSLAALCGALLIIGGLIGAAISGAIVDMTKQFELVSKIAFGLASVAICAFAVLSLHEKIPVAIGAAIFFIGFFGFAAYPIGLELGVECTYPTAEATSSGLIIISGQIQGIIYLMMMSMTASNNISGYTRATEVCTLSNSGGDIKVQDWRVPLILWAGLGAITVMIFIMFFRPIYKRIAIEKEKKAGADPDSLSEE